MPDDRNQMCTDVQPQNAAASRSGVEAITDELIRLMENFDGSMRFVPDWSDEPFRRAA